MKKTSRVLRFNRIEPSAPWWSIAGPELTLIATPSSLAMMCASVVLPRPGGPQSSTCSTGCARHNLERGHRVKPRLELDDHLRRGALTDSARPPDGSCILAHDGALQDLEARRAQDVQTYFRSDSIDLDQHLEKLELFDRGES